MLSRRISRFFLQVSHEENMENGKTLHLPSSAPCIPFVKLALNVFGHIHVTGLSVFFYQRYQMCQARGKNELWSKEYRIIQNEQSLKWFLSGKKARFTRIQVYSFLNRARLLSNLTQNWLRLELELESKFFRSSKHNYIFLRFVLDQNLSMKSAVEAYFMILYWTRLILINGFLSLDWFMGNDISW